MADTAAQAKKPLCFVIGPIGNAGSPIRKHADHLLYGIVKSVLENPEFNYDVQRADHDPDPGMIDSRVIMNLRRAELVVADLTDLNPNVFYELGIRHSAEKPVITLARTETKLPFDVNANRTIFVDVSDHWSLNEAREHLAASARAIKAPDFQVSNPITQANANFAMRNSADPRDHVLAELQERVASLEAREERNRADLYAVLRNTPVGLLAQLAGPSGLPFTSPSDQRLPFALTTLVPAAPSGRMTPRDASTSGGGMARRNVLRGGMAPPKEAEEEG